MPESDRQPADIETLAEEFLQRQRRGESPSIAEYAARHPNLADEIRELFPTITAMERLKVRHESSGDGRASLGPVRLERLGEFRFVREIGRGGMGVVYEAEQESLGRRVAVKVLPRHALLDPHALDRFRREAELAAGLHHTNIVQVYGVGEQDGFHYYAMQFVDGAGLDEVIQRLGNTPSAPAKPQSDLVARMCRQLLGAEEGCAAALADRPAGRTYWAAVARIGEQIADALQYAHDQGVFHRDIKPSNLLIDEGGMVWVTDFGLARAEESPAVTRDGNVTGTLRYVPPERFCGETDHRGDIYGLGLTLYELLILRPAYEESDRHRLVRQLMQGSTPPRPRELRPDVPRDLETVVLKAIAHDADRRYASAADLAADLRRFQEDRGVLARRASLPERLKRWCRRNPTVAALTGTVAALLVLVAVVASVGYVRTRDALRREEHQRRAAEANADLALEALDRVFARLSPSPHAAFTELPVAAGGDSAIRIPAVPMASPQTAALLEEMLPYYDRLARQTGQEARIRRKVAAANRRVGQIRQRLGRLDQAESAYRRAIDIYKSLDDDPLARASALNDLGQLYRHQRRDEQAEQCHDEALAILTSADGSAPRSPEARYEQARTHFLLATRPPPAPGAKQPPARDPPRRGGRRPGPTRRPKPPPRQASDDHLDKAVELLDTLTSEPKYSASCRQLLALCYLERPNRPVDWDGKNTSDGLTEAIAILGALAKEFPQVPDYRFDLARAHAKVRLHDPLLAGQTYADLVPRLRKAADLAEELTVAHPSVPQYALCLAEIHHKLAAVARRQDRLAEAGTSATKAAGLCRRLVKANPNSASYRIWLGVVTQSLGDILRRQGRSGEAIQALQESADELERALVLQDDLWFVHGLLDKGYSSLANVLRRDRQSQPAEKAEEMARQHRDLIP